MWTLPAVAETVGEMRHHVSGFASACGASRQLTYAIALAVSETVTNVVLHAYVGRKPGTVTVRCRAEVERIVVEVADEGVGVRARRDSPGVGHGLATVGALVATLEIEPRPEGPGTVVVMSFSAAAAAPAAAPGLEPLCALALERVADVSCLAVIGGGVLRRIAAEVAGDPALTTWLRGAVPPTKPGTATWAALREGGAQLVIHDPAVPRSPGGTGERLELQWWLSVPVADVNGTPAALWGLGGRAGGRPVPSFAIQDVLADAAGGGLAQEADRAMLRARLALT
jgi:anti-sigma regulatory factor (Ser/Thr protein kinase)